MALGNFTNCLPVTLAYEGGWADHPRDPGGATMKGITLAVYRGYRPGATKANLRAITPTEVEMIYRGGYWTPIKGDDLPAGVDLATFDFGVNSGVSRAAKYLQAVVGVAADGKIGPGTLSAVKSASGKEVIQSLCGRRLSFVSRLGTFKTFGKGWSRRIANVEAKAVAMWLNAQPLTAPAIRATLLDEADTAIVQVKVETRKSAGSVAGGSVAATASVVPAEPNWLLIGAIAVVVVAALTVFVRRAMVHMERADAYAAAAGATE